MKRTKPARLNFSASKLFRSMSARCAVQLQGVCETMLAIMPIVAGVEIQWTWM